MKKIILSAILCSFAMISNAQFKKLPSGIEYKIIQKGKANKTAKMGDYIAVILKGTCSGVTLFDTKQINKGVNVPVNFTVQKKQYNGDVIEVLQLLNEGDSFMVRIPHDSFFRMPPANHPKNIKLGESVVYLGKVYTIRTAAEFKKAQEDAKKAQAEFAKQQKAMKVQQDAFAKQQRDAKALIKKDDAAILNYISTNNLGSYTKTAGGTYVIIEKEGDGDFAKPGMDITMNYNGQLFDGSKFDSNTDTAFGHVSPFKFRLGTGAVIRGWDEGVQKFKKGSKGKIILPSGQGYGAGGSGKIKPNSNLVFDVELVDFTDPLLLARQQDSAIQNFLKENNITNAKKTNSGLYIVTNEQGAGTGPKEGDSVVVNYTGMFLNGQKFDSNTDSLFGHVTPFQFALARRNVIAGWDEGVATMSKGSKSKLIIPSALAYGANGQGSIPANSILQFDVDLLDYKKGIPTPPQQMSLPPQLQQIKTNNKKKK